MHTTNLQILHFDTINQWSVQSPTSVFYKTGFHPFNLILNLPYQISKVKRIYLKSVELPVGFTNIRDTNTSNSLSMNISKIINFPTSQEINYSFDITLPNKNYTNIQSLLTDINSLIATDPVVQQYSRSINPPFFTASGQKVSINVDTLTNFSFNDTILSKYILGFSWNVYLFIGTIYEAPSNYNIVYDTYLIMNFPKLNAKSNGVTQQISFKIPYNATYNQIYFDYENTTFSQFIELSDDNTVIGNLQLIVTDRFGNNINNNGLDWSFTLGFQTN